MYIPYPNELLRLTPWETIITLINQQYNTTYESVECELLGIDPGYGDTVEIQVAVKENHGLLRLCPPLKQYLIKIERCEVQHHLGTFVPVNPGAFYKHTSDIIQEMQYVFPEIHLTEHDFVEENIPVNAERYVLKASKYSMRWWGELIVMFHQ